MQVLRGVKTWKSSRYHASNEFERENLIILLGQPDVLLATVSPRLLVALLLAAAPLRREALSLGFCHNVVMILGRHNPDSSNEKAISDLGFLVNAQVYGGEIIESFLLGIIIKAKHHSCNLLWKVELVFLFIRHCRCPR